MRRSPGCGMLDTLRRRSPRHVWARAWLRLAGAGFLGRLAARLAAWGVPPYKGRLWLAEMSEKGYISPSATVFHKDLRLGKHVLVGDGSIIFQWEDGGPIDLGDRTMVFGDALLETGQRGSIRVGPGSRIDRGCQLIAYKASILIGRDVGIGPNCALYSYSHGTAPGRPISEQPLQSKGPIILEDRVCLGTGVIVLDGVRIGTGAVIGARAVVTRDVPAHAVAAGVPARVVGTRTVASQEAATGRGSAGRGS